MLHLFDQSIAIVNAYFSADTNIEAQVTHIILDAVKPSSENIPNLLNAMHGVPGRIFHSSIATGRLTLAAPRYRPGAPVVSSSLRLARRRNRSLKASSLCSADSAPLGTTCSQRTSRDPEANIQPVMRTISQFARAGRFQMCLIQSS